MKLHEIEKEELLINRMYAGSYLENEHNIGHEVINLLRTDKGENYIYVQPLGTMNAKHNGKIDTIILTRNTEIANTFEVLAQAWELEQISKIEKYTHKKEIKDIAKKQIDYIKDNNITYNGKLLNEIYNGNTFQQDVCVSFKAKELRKPNKPMFIYFGIDNETLKVLKDKGTVISLNTQNIELVGKSEKSVNAAKSSLKMYIKKSDQTNAFKNLQEILEDASYWEDKNTTQDAKDVFHFYKYDNYNFIDLIDKQNAEATYSNLFKYIFESDYELFKKFAKEVLKIDNISGKYKVEREEGHIDLLITDENNVIVIENKIKSGINGIQYDIHGETIGSQLNDYYRYVTEYKSKNSKTEGKNLKEKFENKKKSFFIFTPDYNKINTEKIKLIPNTYKVIPYSKIYEFFDKLHTEDCYKYSNKIQYFYEFIYAIEKHSNRLDNVLEIETHKKFIKKCSSK